MADKIKCVIIVLKGCSEIPLKQLKKRIARAKRLHPNAEITLRIFNRQE